MNYKKFNKEMQAIQDKLTLALKDEHKNSRASSRYYLEQFRAVLKKYKVKATTSLVSI